MKKYPKLRYPGEEETQGLFTDGTVYIQEKLDGANFRWCLEEHLEEEYHTEDRDFVFGSRSVPYKNEKDVDKSFSHAVEFIRENVDPEDVRDIEELGGGEPVVFFGEAMHPHTLEYDWDTTPSVIGFDVWMEETEDWFHPEAARKSFDDIGIPFSPIIDRVEVDEWDEYDFEVPQSQYGDVQAEGVVFKNPDTGVRGKLVREDFKEKNNKKFGKSKKQQTSDEEKLSYQYITDARIRKCAHKLIDEGDFDSLKMEMMPVLIEDVIRDMAEEEAGEIFMSERWEIDLSDFRSVTADRCSHVLQHMIEQQVFEEVS